MTPEKLKLLAEALGYEPVIENNTIKVEIDYTPLGYDEKGGGLFVDFNPESNPSQREEVLLWLLGKGWEVRKHGFHYYFSRIALTTKLQSVRSDDYTTALMMAAEAELG